MSNEGLLTCSTQLSPPYLTNSTSLIRQVISGITTQMKQDCLNILIERNDHEHIKSKCYPGPDCATCSCVNLSFELRTERQTNLSYFYCTIWLPAHQVMDDSSIKSISKKQFYTSTVHRPWSRTNRTFISFLSCLSFKEPRKAYMVVPFIS